MHPTARRQTSSSPRFHKRKVALYLWIPLRSLGRVKAKRLLSSICVSVCPCVGLHEELWLPSIGLGLCCKEHGAKESIASYVWMKLVWVWLGPEPKVQINCVGPSALSFEISAIAPRPKRKRLISQLGCSEFVRRHGAFAKRHLSLPLSDS